MTLIRKSLRPAPIDLALLQREMNQLLERLADLDQGDRRGEGEWAPAVDIYECRGQLTVVAEVPGLVPESLRVVYRDRHLFITGERRERRPPAGQASYLCLERPQGRFARAVPLDVPIDIKDAEAQLAKGLLTVTIPRLKDRRGKETVIEVKREEPDGR